MSVQQVTTKYILRKKMKYNGKVLEAGAEFKPAGGKWDAKILDPDNGLVTIQTEIKDKPKPRRRRKATTT